MCGIGVVALTPSFSINESAGTSPAVAAKSIADALLKSVANRGPDHQSYHTIDDNTIVCSSVLHIQGDSLQQQPYADADGNIIMWNGECFSFNGTRDYDSDTVFISTKLSHLFTTDSYSGSMCEYIERMADGVAHLMSCIHGPYTFVYYHKKTSTFFYGRDPMGRRSLLIGSSSDSSSSSTDSSSSSIDASASTLMLPSAPSLLLCSVTPAMTDLHAFDWSEVSVNGIYAHSMHGNGTGTASRCMAKWPITRVRLGRMKHDSSTCLRCNTSDSLGTSGSIASYDEIAKTFLDIMLYAVKKRVTSMALPSSSLLSLPSRIGVLFSGGIDSVFISALLHLSLPSNECIDLINVSFSNDTSSKIHRPTPDRLAAIVAITELKALYPDRVWRLIHVDVDNDDRETYTSHITQLIKPSDTHMDLNIGTAFFFAAKGYGYLREYTDSDCLQALGATDKGRPLLRTGSANGAALSVGVSTLPTGSSSTDTAASRCKCSNERCRRISKNGCVKLLCNKCCLKANNTDAGVIYICPVHKNKHNTIAALPTVIAVDGLEVDAEDTNIAVDYADSCDDGLSLTYTTSACRVLLVGIGADEQMAGYGRHRTAFLRGGIPALESELHMDTDRIWKRNLGRDDRIIADHGREAWFPFLDEAVVEYLQSLCIHDIANLNLLPGIGDKLLLRSAARILGLSTTTEFVKRAIQFGTRIAQSTNILYHGSHSKGKGTTKIVS